MKALILHANRYGSRVESPSDRLGGVTPEELRVPGEEMEECLVVLFQVEDGDGDHQVNRLCRDVKRITAKVGTQRLMLGAFGHLSHKWPESPEIAKQIAGRVVAICRTWEGYEVRASQFGHNKTLLLDIKGHPNALKHRSY